ncbi:MAG: acyl-CoA dehydrogenase [Burkholderiaceae bacterium]
MNFQYTEEQQLLADSVRRYVDKEYDFETRRKRLAAGDGCDPQVWAAFAEMGLLALPLPAEHGGFGGTAVDLIGVMEAFGDALVVEPYLPTVVLGARLVALAGSDAQKAEILPAVAEGKLKLAFAHGEADARYERAQVAAKAVKQGDGWALSGKKIAVLGAPLADKLIVSARTSGGASDEAGISLFIVDRQQAGVSLAAARTFDDARAADIELNEVQVPGAALLGKAGEAFETIDDALDFASAVLCAQALGAMQYANGATLEYIKTRKQFGVPIGSFQALQHRMVDMTISAEQSRSMVYLACTSVNGEKPAAERRRLVSAARVKVADACRHVSQESVQLHGGMGMTEELKVSHTFRLLTLLARRFGDADYHLQRFIQAA